MVQRRRRKAGSVGEVTPGVEAGTRMERERERGREARRSMGGRRKGEEGLTRDGVMEWKGGVDEAGRIDFLIDSSRITKGKR